MKKLLIIPDGTSLQDHIASLESRPSAHDAYNSAMMYPQRIVEEIFRNLTLDGRPVVVQNYATEEDVDLLREALSKFCPNFSEDYRSKSQLSKMPEIKRLLESPDHCRITPFTFELRLCGKTGCVICALIGRTPKIPNAVVQGKNLRDEMLRWIDLPVPDPSDKEHFLPPQQARKAISKGLTFDKLKDFIPNAKDNSKEKNHVKEANKADRKRGKDAFHASKVRGIAKCDSCGASRVYFSKQQVGVRGGPTKKKLEAVQFMLENGYVCGNPISDITGFYIRTSHQCGNYIEPAYYNPATGLRGGRIVTDDICAICYSEDDIVSTDIIRGSRDTGGKNPLPMCKYCYDKKLPVPTSNNRPNQLEKAQQAATRKRRLMKDAIGKHQRKSRK